MIDSFARRTGLIAIGQSGVKATQLIVAVFLVRMLSPEQWAETAYPESPLVVLLPLTALVVVAVVAFNASRRVGRSTDIDQ